MTTPETEIAIPIEDLREAGADGGDLMGYYARGHHDFHAFADAANRHSGADCVFDRRYVRAEHCRHGWWRTTPISGEPGNYRFVPAEPRGRGAWAVTYCESVAASMAAATQRLIQEYDRGHRNGFCEGVNWAVHALEETGNSAAAAAVIKRYRAAPEQPQ